MRCQFHLQQNAQAFAQRLDQRKEIAGALRRVFQAPTREEADRQVKLAVEQYQNTNSKLAVWMENNVIEGRTCFAFPEQFRRRIRTTNMVERNNRELIVDIRRRIEIFVLKAVPSSLSERDIKHLELILERQHKACLENDVANVRETDIRFHEFIIKKYKNNHVEETWRSGLNRMMMKYDRHASLLNNYEEHRRILDCISAKDLGAMVAAVEQNIQ